jgi:type I restriction enzyme S subunit
VSASDGKLRSTPQRLSDLGASLSVKLEPNSLFISIAGTVGKPCVTAVKACIHDGFVYFPRLGGEARFLYRIFECGDCYAGLGKMGTQLNLNTDTVGGIRIALPQPDEMSAIDAFLDRETAKIDALVAEQRRLVELLKEKRQAVISHAVTKGLDPTAPMKDSGVEWLGEVPAHWEVRPLKHLVSLRSGGTPSKDREDYWTGDVPWASAKDLKADRLSDTQDHLAQAAIDDGAANLAPSGSVIVLVRGMMLARIFPVSQISVPMAINQDLKALTGKSGVDNSYLAWLLRGTEAETLNRLDEAGHGTKALRMEAWLSMSVPLPPHPEQQQMVEVLEGELARIDALSGQAQTAITLLQERRSALISAAVTGKIDVRGLVPTSSQTEAA